MHIIEFSPPMYGIEGKFNTFRLGLRYSKLLKKDDKVILINKSKLEVIGYALVCDVLVGKLGDMANQHAHKNHNQFDKELACELLIAAMIKRYGPQMVSTDKKVTVIYLQLLS